MTLLYGDSVGVPDQAVRQTAQDCETISKARESASSREFAHAWRAPRAPRESLENIARRVTIRHSSCSGV
jgi:hypothetical protein